MPQPRADDLEVGPAGEGQRGCSVAEAVQPDRRQVGVADHPVEGAADEIRVQRAAVLAGEDEAGVLPHGRVRRRLGTLTLSVGAEHLDGAAAEGDHSFAVGLGRGLLGGPAELDDLAGDDDLPVLEVDVDPRQPDGLASAQAAEGDEVEQGVEPVISDPVEWWWWIYAAFGA